MSVENLINCLELDCFENTLLTEVHETKSDVKAIVLTYCYGRGKPRSEISVPRLPKGVPARIVIPDADLRQLLPTRKRSGRGRARVLSHHVEDSVELPQRASELRPPVKKVQQKRSLFEFPIEEPVCQTCPGATDVDSFDCYISDEEEDEGYVPLLPSQRGVKNHPFGPPPKPKNPFNVKSSDEFPTLGTTASGPVVPDTNNLATSARLFPPLPPRLSKKVPSFDIEFKPMKKSKKKRKHDPSKSRAKSESESVLEADTTKVDDECDAVCVNVDSGLVPDQNKSPGLLSDNTELSLPDAMMHVKWRTLGSHVVQIDGLPGDVKESELESYVSHYGTVLDSEMKTLSSGKCSFRVKYTDADGAEFAISCLHGSDSLLPDCTLDCYAVPCEENDH